MIDQQHPRLPDIPVQPQRQDSTRDKLDDLLVVATRLGMYDAADWLAAQFQLMDQARTP